MLENKRDARRDVDASVEANGNGRGLPLRSIGFMLVFNCCLRTY